jgi:hypothetical protein
MQALVYSLKDINAVETERFSSSINKMSYFPG